MTTWKANKQGSKKILFGVFLILIALLSIQVFSPIKIYKLLFDKYYQVGTSIPRAPEATFWDNLGKQCWKACWGQINYKTSVSAKNFVDFYKSEMPKNGWVFDSEIHDMPFNQDRYILFFRKNVSGNEYRAHIEYDMKDIFELKTNYIYIKVK